MALPPYQTEIPVWEALRRQNKARMLAQAKEAGIPYTPEYAELLRKPLEMVYPQDRQPNVQYPTPAPQPPSSVAATGPGAAPAQTPPQAPPTEVGPPEAGPEPSPYQSVIDQLGPEGVEALLEGQAIDEQKQYAAALRDTPGAEGRYVRNNIYVGASPLEHLSVGARRYMGGKKVKEAQGKQQELRKSIIDLLREKTEDPESTPPFLPVGNRGLM